MRRLYIIVQSIFYSNKTNSIVNKKLQVESSILENFSKETFFVNPKDTLEFYLNKR